MKDYIVVTDGSGHMDGFGGWAAVISALDGSEDPVRLCGGQNGTSVDRMEFTALLEALSWITKEYQPSDHVRATVYWICDRQALVRTVNREYVASANKDLYYRLAFYEQILNVKGRYVDRDNGNKDHSWCDAMSTEMRRLVKSNIDKEPVKHV